MALITKQELNKLADKRISQLEADPSIRRTPLEKSAIQQALIEQVTQYISQYTPQPRIISYKPNASGDVMGKFESQSRVFTFRLSDKGLVYKPLVQRKDNESDDDYALRFDTGSELWLSHFTQDRPNLDRTDAAKAFKPKPSVAIKKERGTKAQPKCSAISYHCGVCISLGKNCIKNANTAVLKERLQKINSLSRMVAKGQAVPQVKTGVIGAKVDPASLKKKASDFAKKQAGGVKSTNPKKAEPTKKELESELAQINQSLATPYLVGAKYKPLIVSNPDRYEALTKRAKEIESSLGREKREFHESTQEQAANILRMPAARHKKYVEEALKSGKIVPPEVLKDYPDLAKQSIKAKQSAQRAAAEPNKTTTLSTPLPLTAQSQKRLERGESISDNETYHVKKEGNKFRVTNPNKFEDEGKLVEKAGLAQHMKELESKPSAVKRSSSMNPVIPINSNPDTMLRALRDGRLIGDAKQGYEIQQRGKDEYLVTTMPNKVGDYSGVMSKKELVDFVKSGGDGARFNKEAKPDAVKPTKTNSQKSAQATKLLEKTKTSISGLQDRLEKLQDEGDNLAKQLEDSKSKVPTNRTKKRASDYKDIGKMSKALDEEFANGGNAIAVTKQKGNKKQIDELNNKINENYNTRSEIQSQIKTLTKRAQQLDRTAYDYGNKPDAATEDKKLPPIPLTSGKNLTPSQKKQSRTADQVAIDRTKNDVSNATKRINTLDDSIKKLKAGKGVMSEGDLKKVAALERSKSEWEKTREGHKAKLEKLSKKETPQTQGTGETEAERRQFLLNTNTEQTNKKPEPKREIELADIKSPQDHIKYATQELAIAKASKDPERINKWIDELQRAKKRSMSQAQVSANTYQPDLFFVNKGNPNQKSIFDSANRNDAEYHDSDRNDAEYDDSVERNILSNIGLMVSRAMTGNQTSPNTVQLRKVKYADGNVSGIFTQYGSQYDFGITDKGVVISPLQVRQDSVVRQDRIAGIAYQKTAKIGANRKCGRGYKCKGSCISKNNKCRVNWATKEGLEQFKSMQAELKNLTSPRFIEIDGRQVAQQRTPAEDAKTLALAKRLSEARGARKEFADESKTKAAKYYKAIGDRVDAKVAEKLKEAGLNVKQVKSTLAELDPKDIAVDPKRFQYKITGEHTASGTVGSLQGVGKWDENLAGILQVWKDPADGKTYVVNGHNRLSKANELGAEKVAVRYLDVPSHQEARTIGAMTNIAEGHGTALDAAKFFRDTNWTKEDVIKKGIPLKEKIATDGLAIASLEANLFRQVIDGELPMERAAIIGGNGLSHEKQKSLMELLDKRKNVNNSVLSELIDTVKNSGQKQEEQFDLFGNSTATVDLAIQRASLQSYIKQKLGSEKKLFGTVSKSKSAKDLERGGNQIDVDQSSKIADEAATALKMFDTVKHNVGGVSDTLNSASERLAVAKTKAERDKISRETYENVLKNIQQEHDKLFKGTKRSDSRQRADASTFGSTAFNAQNQILTYVTDNSGNMMGICQLNGVKYRFLKPVFGATVLAPLSDTNLGYLFDMAPDLTLRSDSNIKRTAKGNVTASARAKYGDKQGKFPIWDEKSAISALNLRGHADDPINVLNRVENWAVANKNEKVKTLVEIARLKDKGETPFQSELLKKKFIATAS